MATASQNIIETKFLVLIRGALTPPPMMDTPVEKIPMAAPTTLRLIASAMPILHHMKGDIPIHLDKNVLVSDLFLLLTIVPFTGYMIIHTHQNP